MKIILNEKEVPFDFVRSKKARRFRMQINNEGRLKVVAPLYALDFEVKKFLKTHDAWLQKHLARLTRKKDPNVYYYLGETFGLNDLLRGKWKSVQAFYRQKAEEVIRDRLDHFNDFYGFTYRRVTFRNQKSRWGSCSRLKNLNFNWRLVMAPIEVIDYVVIHELCHLKEMNHSARFWALVTLQAPDFKIQKKWLKENHHLLSY